MAATHTIAAQKIGIKIDSLTKQMEEEPDGRLRAGLQKMIGELKQVLKIELPKDQQKQAEIKKADDIKKAKTSTDLLNIAGDHNDSIENIMVTKMGGNIPVTKAAYGTNIPRHGLFGNIGNTASNATQNPVGTIAGGTVGGGVGTGLGSVVGGTLGTLVGGPIGTAAGTTLGASIGGTIGTGVGASYGANGQFPWQNNDNTMASEGSSQQNLPPPPPFAPPMNGPGAGYKPVHDAYYANGGEVPRYNYGSALAGIGQAAGYGNMAGGLLGLPENEFDESELWNTGKNVAGLVPAAAPYTAIEKTGSELIGLPEWFDPAGSLFGSFKKDPETGKRDWSKIAANLFGGSVGGFLWNQMNEPEKRGGVAGLLSGNRKEYGGDIPRYNTAGNIPWQDMPWKEMLDTTGSALNTGAGVMNQANTAAPINYNNQLLQQPTQYIGQGQPYSPFTPGRFLWDDLNNMKGTTNDINALARQEEYYSPNRELFELDKGYQDARKSMDYYGDPAIQLAAQMNLAGNNIDKRQSILASNAEKNYKANSPEAKMKKLGYANQFDNSLFSNAFQLDQDFRNAQAQAFQFNNQSDAAYDNIGRQNAENIAEYSRGNTIDNMTGSGLNMGMFYQYNPYTGVSYKTSS